MLDKKDQWLTIYTLRASTPEREGFYGSTPGEVRHVWHPRACHPFLKERMAHRLQEEAVRGTIVACGRIYDDRRFVIESKSDIPKCEACLAAHKAAEAEHAEANKKVEELRAKQVLISNARTKVYLEAIERSQKGR